MKKRLKIVLDCDDVLYQCNQTAVDKLNKEYGTCFTLNDIKEWGLTGTAIDNRMKYYDDPEFIRELPLIEGAKEFVKKLSKVAEIFICTSVQPNCASARLASIIENFPEIKVSNIIIGGRKDMIVADFMFDDCILNLEKANVTYPVLMQRPWNCNGNAGLLSVNGYDEFLQLVETVMEYDNKSEYNVCTLIGPSGSGKTAIVDKLKKEGFESVTTYTTAKKRGANYKTISFAEFMSLKETGFFSETSVYLGDCYGIVNKEIDEILQKGKIPLLTVDVNGAMAVSRFYNTLNCFVESPKSECVKNILNKNLPIDMATERICSLDGELKNKQLCDITISGLWPDISVITECFK